MELWHFPALVAGGILCGIINALAGGGSFVTLPLLLLIGLPPQIANATNRVAITLQCGAGVATYHRHGVRPWRHLPPIAIAAGLGALLGAYLAAHIDETAFRRVAALLFVFMIATVFIDAKRWAKGDSQGRIKPYLYPVFFLMGIYGGFLQAGLGTLLISTFVLLGGFDVVSGNALKFSLAFVFTAVALALFAGVGHVRWLHGLCLAIGTMTGGIIGARLVMAKGARWVRVVVVLSAIGAILKLLFSG
ncbi:sulfite exporter TauE/SafE family protein [Candidatus Eisenbacteria bacterium]|uniref:Probable membrane transporter protein n=1 Tax=Eiseniibacteriota bacterium TaxID=2212470 RepID=A0ABV6YK39_UNCEI